MPSKAKCIWSDISIVLIPCHKCFSKTEKRQEQTITTTYVCGTVKTKVGDDLMLLQYHMYICRAYRSVHEVGWLFDGDLFHHLWVAYHQNRSVSNVEPRVKDELEVRRYIIMSEGCTDVHIYKLKGWPLMMLGRVLMGLHRTSCTANDLVHAHLCIVIVRSTFRKNTVMEVLLLKRWSL